MAETLQIFDHRTVLKIRAVLLEDGFEKELRGSAEEIADRVGGRLVDSGLTFDEYAKLEVPPIGSDDFDETDRINTEVVHDALRGLTPFGAARDELWATLCFGPFRHYLQRRWRPNSQQAEDLRKNYQLRYLSSTVRNRWRDNAIGRLWWLRHYGSAMVPEDPQMALSVLFFRDKNLGEALLTKPSIATVPAVGRAVMELAHEYFIEPGHYSFSRPGFRQVVKEIEVNSGRMLLATMPTEDVRELVRGLFATNFDPVERRN